MRATGSSNFLFLYFSGFKGVSPVIKETGQPAYSSTILTGRLYRQSHGKELTDFEVVHPVFIGSGHCVTVGSQGGDIEALCIRPIYLVVHLWQADGGIVSVQVPAG